MCHTGTHGTSLMALVDNATALVIAGRALIYVALGPRTEDTGTSNGAYVLVSTMEQRLRSRGRASASILRSRVTEGARASIQPIFHKASARP